MCPINWNLAFCCCKPHVWSNYVCLRIGLSSSALTFECWNIRSQDYSFLEHSFPNMLAAGPSYATRGHDLRLQKIRTRYDLRKYYFTNRVVNMWNSLSSYVVSAESETVSRIDLIISGKIRRLFTIFVRRFTEPETAVKFRFDSFRK